MAQPAVGTLFGARWPNRGPGSVPARQLAVAGAIGSSARLLRERRARCGVCYLYGALSEMLKDRGIGLAI